jgi:hypothetical protein
MNSSAQLENILSSRTQLLLVGDADNVDCMVLDFDLYYQPFCELLEILQTVPSILKGNLEFSSVQRESAQVSIIIDRCVKLLCAYFRKKSYVSPSVIFSTVIQLLRSPTNPASSSKPLPHPFHAFSGRNFIELASLFLENIGIVDALRDDSSKIIDKIYGKANEGMQKTKPQNSTAPSIKNVHSLWMNMLSIDCSKNHF